MVDSISTKITQRGQNYFLIFDYT